MGLKPVGQSHLLKPFAEVNSLPRLAGGNLFASIYFLFLFYCRQL